MLLSELTPEIVLFAYRHGCFPMPDELAEKVIWHRPNPRAIIPLNSFHVGRTLKRVLKRTEYSIEYDSCFEKVMRACANRTETWITEDIIRTYSELHSLGSAHSIEVFCNDSLVGGVYGVALGAAFFAESMFHAKTDMSKLALFHLVEHLKQKDFKLLECQFLTPHLASLGAIEIEDQVYMKLLNDALQKKDSCF